MSRTGHLKSWGRLLRLSLMPSAAADVAAGLVLASAGTWPLERDLGAAPWLLILGSLCIYHAGMALNDWADRAHDAATRGDRPIPSGTIRPGAALGAALLLTLIALLCAWSASAATGWWMAGLAFFVWAYDLRGRGPLLGPGLLAVCRAGNMGLGIVFVTTVHSSAVGLVWIAPLLYGAYVFVVSRLARIEDGEQELIGKRPRNALIGAALLLLCVVLVPVASTGLDGFLGPGTAFLIAAAGAFGLARLAASRETWTPPRVGAAVGCALRRLLVFSSAVCALAGTPGALLVAGLILCGYPVAHMLRGLFPPT